jgi:hypothetical protein
LVIYQCFHVSAIYTNMIQLQVLQTKPVGL